MNPFNQNPYVILGLSSGATEKQIKKVYRRLAVRFHPDKIPNDPEAEKKFKQIQWDYESLRKHKGPQAVPPDDSPQGHPFCGFSRSVSQLLCGCKVSLLEEEKIKAL